VSPALKEHPLGDLYGQRIKGSVTNANTNDSHLSPTPLFIFNSACLKLVAPIFRILDIYSIYNIATAQLRHP